MFQSLDFFSLVFFGFFINAIHYISFSLISISTIQDLSFKLDHIPEAIFKNETTESILLPVEKDK